jgi:hypothetical protein
VIALQYMYTKCFTYQFAVLSRTHKGLKMKTCCFYYVLCFSKHFSYADSRFMLPTGMPDHMDFVLEALVCYLFISNCQLGDCRSRLKHVILNKFILVFGGPCIGSRKPWCSPNIYPKTQ